MSESFDPSRRHDRVCLVLREQSKTVTRPAKLLVVAPHQRAGMQQNDFKKMLSRIHDVRELHTLRVPRKAPLILMAQSAGEYVTQQQTVVVFVPCSLFGIHLPELLRCGHAT